MLTTLKKRLEGLLEIDDQTSDDEKASITSFAAAALLIEAAQADTNIDEIEIREIKNSLIESLGVRPQDIDETIQVAKSELEHATCLHQITSTINENWQIRQKVVLIEALWKVVLSDQYLDPNERHLMHKIKGLLHIPQAEYIAAKLRAQNSLESGADS